MNHGRNPLVPQVATIVRIRTETPDVKTFYVKGEGGIPFNYMPGQCGMITIPPAGEAIFSITSSPTRGEFLEFSIKRVGQVTDALHEAPEGKRIGVRGPYGNGFPIDLLKGKDLLFIGGGIGLAPLRSLINYAFDRRGEFGHIDIIYGARSPQDLVFKDELFEIWPGVPDVKLYLTVDAGDGEWKGHVGFVPAYLEEINPAPEGKIAITCGPPIMIKFVLQALKKMGYEDDQIVTTLEMKMKCGIGKCGRCNIGSKYVCLDGPVFTLKELNELPAEY